MRDSAQKVGIGRLVRLAWLEETASLISAGNDKAAVHDALDLLLTDQISLGGNAPRSGREKAITVLMKTWLLVPDGLEPLRDDGLHLLNHAGDGERVAVHWGMLLAAYPFWGAVAARTGRLLRVQGRAAAAQVKRGIREEYGERPSVERAARYVLRSFVDWGVLVETDTKGVYAPAPPVSIRNPNLVAWLAEAVLRSRAVRAASPRALLRGPRLFPFHPPVPPGTHSHRIPPGWTSFATASTRNSCCSGTSRPLGGCFQVGLPTRHGTEPKPGTGELSDRAPSPLARDADCLATRLRRTNTRQSERQAGSCSAMRGAPRWESPTLSVLLSGALGGLFLFLEDSVINAGSWKWLVISFIFVVSASIVELRAYRRRHGDTQALPQPPTVRASEAEQVIEPIVEEQTRQMCPKTPAELFALVEGKTEIQAKNLLDPYRRTWLSLEGRVTEVTEFGSDVTVLVEAPEQVRVTFWMKEGTDKSEFLSLAHGDLLSAMGQIRDVSPREKSPWEPQEEVAGGSVILAECERVL